MAEVVAKHLGARISDQKGRLIADLIRGMKVDKALTLLKFTPKKGAALMLKVLESAIANAENNVGLDVDELKVAHVLVDRGVMLKRFHARAKGRGNRVVKSSSNIAIVLTDGR